MYYKTTKKQILSIVAALALTLTFHVEAVERNINIDFNWKFALGDHLQAKNNHFDDESWRELNLPHDFSIEGEYSKDAPAGIRGAFLPTGVGWYRKHLTVPEHWQGKKIILRFDGVYLNSDVWVNGQHIGHRPNGYMSFEYDISDALMGKGKPPAQSVIAVRVDHSLAPSGRWYTGSGIYRHVWLDVVEPTHIVNDGIFVRTGDVDFKRAQAKVLVDTEINLDRNPQGLRLQHDLIDANGKVVNHFSEAINTNQGTAVTVVKSEIEVTDAKLWSPDSPYLYHLNSVILDQAGKTLDQKTTRVGIRTIDYNPEQGFLLNNQQIELQGVSLHHDGGPVGSAVPDDLWRSRLTQLKNMGVNALRPAHTPFAPVFYDLADEIGLMVMDEAFDGWEREKADFDYGLHFETWWKTDLTAFIRRDRSHPSVVMWSVGNEVPGSTAETQKKLVDVVKSLDDTRPVTQARGYMLKHDDISGFNGHGEQKGVIEKYHKENPNRTVVGTEITHTQQTRGIYRTKTSYRTRDNPAAWEKVNNLEKWARLKPKVHLVEDFTEQEVFTGEKSVYDSSYDNAIVRMSVRDEIRMANRLPYLLGTFRWTAFDYLGESFGWPAKTANFGIIDLAGFEKDAYYLYQSQWSKSPMVHLLPHWTHPGKEGVEIPVVVYTNLAEAELFLNGNSLGKKSMTDEMQIVWLVPYAAGELKVIATDGETRLTKVVRTAGEARTVTLTPDRETLAANQTDVALVTIDIVDKHGEIVPRALNLVSIELSGPGKIIGVENGDILDHSHHVATNRKAFNGKLRVMIQSTDQAGKIELQVSGKGLQSQTLVIPSQL